MNTKQTNRVTMYKTVIAQLQDNVSIWGGMAPFVATVGQVEDKVTAIDSAAQQQELPSGATDSKEVARDALEDVLFLFSEALGTLAHTLNNHDLAALTDVTPSTFDRMGEEELSNRAASIAAAAQTFKTDLAGLQVTQANLDELDQALQHFNAIKEEPRRATTERMVHTESIPTLIRETSRDFRRIDRMVNLFRRSHPEFVAAYRAARVIVDRAASHRTTQPTTSPPSPA